MHVITGLRIGGAENQLLLLARHTRTTPTVVALYNADEVADALRDQGVEVVSLGMRSNKDLRAIFRLANFMRQRRPDVVHVHLFRAILYGRVAAFLARVPVVVTTEHSLHEDQIEGQPLTPAIRLLYRRSEPLNHATVAVSPRVAALLRGWGVPPEKVRIIPNGVDFEALRSSSHRKGALRRDLGIPREADVIGGLGRLHHTKRWDLLIGALAAHLGPDRRLLLVGGGDEEPRLRGLVEQLGIAPWVRMESSRSDLAAVFEAMDVVVSPSPQETFGLALIEAVAAGRRVVYVDSPALDALGPLTGVHKVHAEESAIREAVLEVLAGPDTPAPLEKLRHYDIRTVAREVDDLYESLVRARGQERSA